MRATALAAVFLLAACGQAESAPDVAIAEAWARPTLPGQLSSAAYFSLSNGGGGDRLLSVASPAGQASLHSVTMDGAIARMRPLEALEIPAGSTVVLEPGGTHVMLTGLEAPLAEGQSLALDLEFEKSGIKRVDAPVRNAEGAGN